MAKGKIGCGPNSWTTGESDPFYCACVAHDLAYETHSMSQDEADDEFFEAMEEIVAAEKNPLKRAWLTARMFLYEGIVTSLGWLWWYYL